MEDDNDMEDFFSGSNLSFEQTMIRMEAIEKIFQLSGKIEFYDTTEEDVEGVFTLPFRFFPDTSFGFEI